MKRGIFSLLVGLTVAGGVLVAQTTAPQSPQPPKVMEVMLTGCLSQGSGPSVFVLDNARMDPKDAVGKAYLIVPGTEDLDLEHQVNHEVTISGSAEDKIAPPPPAGQRWDEMNLPKLTAKALTKIADSCSAAW